MLRRARPVAVLLLWLMPAVAGAAGSLSVDARFDKTGDGIVDASDWAKMDEKTKLEYARESVAALGEDPDVMLEGRKTRAERYLEGLRAVYE